LPETQTGCHIPLDTLPARIGVARTVPDRTVPDRIGAVHTAPDRIGAVHIGVARIVLARIGVARIVPDTASLDLEEPADQVAAGGTGERTAGLTIAAQELLVARVRLVRSGSFRNSTQKDSRSTYSSCSTCVLLI
jgi:hypothetical protein